MNQAKSEATPEDTPERVNRASIDIKTVSQQTAFNEESMIRDCLPEHAFDDDGGVDMALVVGSIAPGGNKTYAYNGVVFLEIDAPQIKNIDTEGMYIITAVTRYRKIES